VEDQIQFKLNGNPVKVPASEGSGSLLGALRGELGLTGTKYGCGEGHCGSCTVLMNGKAVRSCVTSLKNVQDHEVLTIEGLAKGDSLHPLQTAFIEHGALQCGYCTPGMIMNAYALLRQNPKASQSQIVQGMENNFCRCGAHTRIVRAIEVAALEMKRGKTI